MQAHLLSFLSNYSLFILPISVLITVFGVMFLRKKFPRAIFLLFLLPLFGVVCLIFAGDWHAAHVFKNGLKGEAVILESVPTNNYVNHVQVIQYNCLLKLSDGRQVRARIENSSDIFYPNKNPLMSFGVGKKFPIRYIAGDESNFIIPTDVSNSEENCNQMLLKVSSAQAAYNLDKNNTQNKKEFKKAIEYYLTQPCDTNMQTAFRLLLQQLDNN